MHAFTASMSSRDARSRQPNNIAMRTCVEIKISRRVHAIDATPARWRGDAGSSLLDQARTAASSPRNDLVENYRAPDTLVDFHTGRTGSTRRGRTARDGTCWRSWRARRSARIWWIRTRARRSPRARTSSHISVERTATLTKRKNNRSTLTRQRRRVPEDLEVLPV